MDVIDARTAVQPVEPKEDRTVISLLDVKVWKVSARVRESLTRAQGFMVLQCAEEIRGDSA